MGDSVTDSGMAPQTEPEAHEVRRLTDEMATLTRQRDDAVMEALAAESLRQQEEARHRRTQAELAAQLSELQRLNAEMVAARRAALNVMEDAVMARDALRDRERWLAGQKQALHAALGGAPLAVSLAVLVETSIEHFGPTSRAAFYLADHDGKAVHHVVGMDRGYAKKCEGFPIGPDSFACGLAVHEAKPILTADVRQEPLWGSWLSIAEEFDFRACWSFPLRSSEGEVLGTFAVYWRESHEATQADIAFANTVADTAAIIASRHVEAEKRERAEAALAAEKQYAESIVERLHEPLLVLNPDLSVRSANPAFYEHFHVNPTETIGRAVYALGNGQWDIPTLRTLLEDVLPSSNEFNDHEVNHEFESLGRRVMLVNGRRLNHSQLILLGIRDITDRAHAEAALKEADRRKDEFLATLAHELRNPLAPLQSGLELIRLARVTGSVEEARSMMDRQLTQLVRLVDDLLDISRVTSGKLELRRDVIDLRAVINAAVETSRSVVEDANHSLAIVTPDEPIFVNGDATRLAQVVSNLLTNAAKYTRPGGHIRVTVAKANDLTSAGELALISVHDDGIGIPPAMLGRIFETFTQVDREVERTKGGLGIGLSLAQSLVEMHRGTIEASSEGEGLGSEFIIRLPVVVRAMVESDTPNDSAQEVATSSARRILVVDDNVDAARSLSQVLKIMGNDVRTANDGEAGVAVAEQFRPDLVLMDVGMPKVDGYEAARRIRKHGWAENMVLVALTGWGREGDRKKSSDAGFNHHLVKPVSMDTLLQLLNGLKGTDQLEPGKPQGCLRRSIA
jgi:signal transduction histidine kinase/ActR/RegA family two-component response regulator